MFTTYHLEVLYEWFSSPINKTGGSRPCAKINAAAASPQMCVPLQSTAAQRATLVAPVSLLKQGACSPQQNRCTATLSYVYMTSCVCQPLPTAVHVITQWNTIIVL
jgi:hypothetical protein